jgi:hypothetical protein
MMDREKIEAKLEGPAIPCYTFKGKFLGFAGKEKGIMYFMPEGWRLGFSEEDNELICVQMKAFAE